MTVEEIMHSVTIVEPEMSVYEVARIMRNKNIGSVLVRIDKHKYGMATERDMLKKIVAEAKNPKEVRIKEIMTELQYTINHDASEEEASEMFNKFPIRRLPVVKDGEIIGIITSRDLAKRLAFRRIRRNLKRIKSSGRGMR